MGCNQLLLCVSALALLAAPDCAPRRPADEFQANRQTRWLASRVAPNTVLPSPLPSRRNLILSYDLPESDPSFRYMHNKSFLYDNAIAAIAFASTGEWERAEKLLLTLSTLQRYDGSWWFNYNLGVEWPSETDPDFALVRSGAVAWAGYAYCFFLENHPDLPEASRLRALFLNTARKIAGFLEAVSIADSSSPLHGLVTGGSNTIALRMDSTGTPVEKWTALPITWASSEHNIDAHLFYSHLYTLTRDTVYKTRAESIANSMMRVLWSEKDGQFFRGIKGDGAVDSVLALDCAAWAGAFLRNIGRADLAVRCLTTVERDYRNTYDGLTGYRPYIRTPVHETKRINAYYYPEKPDMQWGGFPFCWMEGGYGVLLAMDAAGKTEEARTLLKAWTMRFSPDTLGGIPYSVAEKAVPYQFTLWKSVASTAWHVILVGLLSKKQLQHPFFSKAGE
ncbi:MAG: hypothetical protein V1913_01090 [Fibrobacterota bacterium]